MFGFVQRILPFWLRFAVVFALLNKLLHSSQLKPLDRLADNKITAADNPKTKLWQVPELGRSLLQAAYTVNSGVKYKQGGWISSKKRLMESREQSEILLALSVTPSGHSVELFVNVLQWYGQCVSSGYLLRGMLIFSSGMIMRCWNEFSSCPALQVSQGTRYYFQ